MRTDTYKGFRILTQPYLLRESRRWAADLEIRRRGRAQTIGLDGRYSSEQEAEAQCASVARLIIDGGMPRWSVDELRSGPRRDRPFRTLWIQLTRRPRGLFGILLVAAGAILLRDASSISGYSANLGDVPVVAEAGSSIPPWAGVGVLIAGIALIASGMVKRTRVHGVARPVPYQMVSRRDEESCVSTRDLAASETIDPGIGGATDGGRPGAFRSRIARLVE